MAAAILLAAAGGCGEREHGRVDATRSPHRAEEALRIALDAWKSGQAPEDLQLGRPPIAVHDTAWKSGRLLADYAILDRTDGDVRVDFSVRLTFADSGKGKEKQQTYYVWGKTPLSIYRSEDFERILATDRP